MSLSDKIFSPWYKPEDMTILVEDVKEFIKELRVLVDKAGPSPEVDPEIFWKKFDELAGEKLI